MQAGTANLTMRQGSYFYLDLAMADINSVAINLAGYTSVTAYVGPEYGSAVTVEIGAVFLLVDGSTSENTGDGSGEIRMFCDEDTSEAITWSRGYWQIWLTEPSGKRICIMDGQMQVEKKLPSGTVQVEEE